MRHKTGIFGKKCTIDAKTGHFRAPRAVRTPYILINTEDKLTRLWVAKVAFEKFEW